MGMKCISCGTDNNLRDRTGNNGRCKSCGHTFAFEPSTVTDTRLRFTDPFFAKAIADISSNDTLYFTPKQFFYLLDRRLGRSISAIANPGVLIVPVIFFAFFISIPTHSPILGLVGGSILFLYLCFTNSKNPRLNTKVRLSNSRGLRLLGTIIMALGILLSLGTNSYLLFLYSLTFGLGAIYLGNRQINRQSEISQSFFITKTQFQNWLNRWKQINPIDKILPSPRQEIAPATINSDLTAYSFDRAIICDSAAIAQMLISNNFHFENNCAILSITGYPQSIFSTVLEMLHRNPDLKVYTIHDASPRGVTLVHQLRNSPNWFQNSNVIIYDLGLLPRQVLSSTSMFILSSEESIQQAKQIPQEVRLGLSADELKWLEGGNFVEVESFSPQRIMQVITQGINRSQEVGGSDSLVIIDDVGYDGGGYIYVESFG